MNTPLKTLAVLALALAAGSLSRAAAGAVETVVVTPGLKVPSSEHSTGGAGTIAGAGTGMTPVPDNFIGPLAPNQCYASQCAGAAAPLEGALKAIGELQQNEAVKKDEDAMLKSGVYAAIDRDAAGKGAVITLPDGKIMYSDYQRGFDTLPKTPEQLLSDPKFLADNPDARAALLAAAQKAQQKARDKAQECGSLNAGDGCKKNAKSSDKGGSFTASSVSDPGDSDKVGATSGGGRTEASAEEGGEFGATNFGDIGKNIANPPDGGEVAGATPSGPGGTRPQDPGFSRQSAVEVKAVNADVAERIQSGTVGVIDEGSLGFEKNRAAAVKMNAAIKAGTRVLDSEDDKHDPNAPRRSGTRFFGGN